MYLDPLHKNVAPSQPDRDPRRDRGAATDHFHAIAIVALAQTISDFLLLPALHSQAKQRSRRAKYCVARTKSGLKQAGSSELRSDGEPSDAQRMLDYAHLQEVHPTR